MPTLNKKDGEQKRARAKQAAVRKAQAKQKRVVVEEPEEAQDKVPVATPFSDGIVSPQFRSFPSVPRAGDAEVDLLRAFLRYFSVTAPFIGTVNTKVSFMKKKGGRLL